MKLGACFPNLWGTKMTSSVVWIAYDSNCMMLSLPPIPCQVSAWWRDVGPEKWGKNVYNFCPSSLPYLRDVGKLTLNGKETNIGDTPLFHWTMIMGGICSWLDFSINEIQICRCRQARLQPLKIVFFFYEFGVGSKHLGSRHTPMIKCYVGQSTARLCSL